MSVILKCDNCDKEQGAAYGPTGRTEMPINPATKEKWWSRTKWEENGAREIHACSVECREALGGATW